MDCQFKDASLMFIRLLTLLSLGFIAIAGELVGSPVIAIETEEGVALPAGGPGAVSFGAVLPAAARTLRFVVKNEGASPLLVNQLSLTGPSAGRFSVLPGAVVSLAAGKEGSFDVSFRPTDFVAANATLEVMSNDLVTPVYQIQLTGSGLALPGSARLVRDIDEGILGLSPREWMDMGAFKLFLGTTPEEGAEIWRTDGTEAGTALVVDLVPGTSDPKIILLGRVGGKAIFRATMAGEGDELWATDGTAAGTGLLKDIYPGVPSGVAATDFVVAGGLGFFKGVTSANGEELWCTDGTEEGTRMVVELRPGTGSLIVSPMFALGNEAYFYATVTGSSGLWKSNGTSEGTVFLKALSFPIVNDLPGAVVGQADGVAYFRAAAGSTISLWKTDGTVLGTEVVHSNVYPVSGVRQPGYAGKIGDELLYFARVSFGVGYELYKVNLTTGFASLVKDIAAGSANSVTAEVVDPLGGEISAVWNGKFYFKANDGVTGEELWVSDGTSPGTQRVVDLVPGGGSSSPESFFATSGALFFVATTVSGRELWKTDGTEAGTVLVKDIWPGPKGSITGSMMSLDGGFMFAATDGIRGEQLWKSDGTSEGTIAIGAFSTEVVRSSNAEPVAALNNEVIVWASSAETGQEPWKSNGTANGTVLLEDINPGRNSSLPIHPQKVGQRIVFSAFNPMTNRELFGTNGTVAGTGLVKDIYPGIGTSAEDSFSDKPLLKVMPFGEIGFFAASNSSAASSIWKTDGTAAGTAFFANLAPVGTPYSPYNFVASPGKEVFAFVATGDNDVQAEPWWSDGTVANTKLVANIGPSPGETSKPSDFVWHQGFLYYFASNSGRGLYRSDRKRGGAQLLKNMTSASELISCGQWLYFSAATAQEGTELWRSDGTASGTVLHAELEPGPGSSSPKAFQVIGNQLFFVATSSEFGEELWVVNDGGAPQLIDIELGSGSSRPLGLTRVRNEIWFAATTTATGRELWRSDGTVAGTMLVSEIVEGADGGDPSSLQVAGNDLFFSARHPSVGRELFALDVSSPAEMEVRISRDLEVVSDASELDFGWTLLELERTQRVLVRNWGTLPLVVSSVSLTGPNLGSFSYSGPAAFTLGHGEEAILVVNFPASEVGARSAVLRLQSNDVENPVRDFTLVAGAAGQPLVQLMDETGVELDHDTGALSMGEVQLGGERVVRGIRVRNLTFGTVLETGRVRIVGAAAADFSVSSRKLGRELEGEESGELVVAFSPLGVGVRTAQLLLETANGSPTPYQIDLTGTGLAVVGGSGQAIYAAEEDIVRFAEDGAFVLPFASNRGLPLGVEVVGGSEVGTVSGMSFTPSGVSGSVTLRLTQPGGSGFDAAEAVYKTMMVTSGRFVKLARGAGNLHSAGIKDDGSLWTWGRGLSGELGTGTLVNAFSPQRVGTDTDWRQVSVGTVFTLAIKTDGSLWAWGSGSTGRLGTGDTNSRSVPVRVGLANDWEKVSAGNAFAFAIKTNGTLWSWGSNSSGQLGLGNTATQLTMQQVGTDSDWLDVSAGFTHALALRENGAVWGWGNNSAGQLGDGSTTNRTSPVIVSAAGTCAMVEAGSSRSFAIRRDGSLLAWGSGFAELLGLPNGGSSNRLVPVQVGLENDWSSIYSGANHTMALREDGTLWAWGRVSGVGATGLGVIIDGVPRQVGERRDWIEIGGGQNFSASLSSDGRVWSAGHASQGKLATPINQAVWLDKVGNRPARLASMRTNYIREDGSLWEIQANESSFPDGILNGPRILQKQIEGGGGWSRMHSGNNFIAVDQGDGILWGAGSNASGQFGDGTTLSRSTLSPFTPGRQWSYVTAGSLQMLAIDSEGRLWGWGNNTSSVLGLESASNRNQPEQIGMENDWAQVASNNLSTMAVKVDGSLWGWGSNSSGRLGLGDSTLRLAPTRVGTDNDWVEVSLSSTFSLARKSNGTIWACGNNGFGSLGDGTTVSKTTFVQVGADTDWVKIGAVGTNGLAFKADGTLYGWGANTENQFGDGTETNRLVPAPVLPHIRWLDFAQNSSTTNCLLLTSADGSLWGLGHNEGGQLTERTRLHSVMSNAHPSTMAQTVTVPPIVITEYGVPVTVQGTASSGLPVKFNVAGVGILNNNQLTVTGPGDVYLMAWQPGDLPAWQQSPPMPVEVRLEVPPLIVTQPLSRFVEQAHEVVFQVVAMGSGELSYQWRKNGQPIPSETGLTLTLPSAQEVDMGSYDVIVTNDFGSATSEAAVLEVVIGEPHIVSVAAHQLVPVGGSLHFEVTAMGRAPLRYQWMRNGRAISGANERTLSLWGVGLSDGGEYQVRVTAVSSVVSEVIRVGVVQTAPETRVVEEGKSTVLRAISAGPGLTHSWRYQGGMLPPESQFSLSADGKTLSIQNLKLTDAGLYDCVVSGHGGSVLAGVTELGVFNEASSIQSPQNLPGGIVAGWYEHDIQVTGGDNQRPSRFTARGLPPGLVLNSATGKIRGRPTRAGPFRVTLSATNRLGGGSVTETVVIQALPDHLEGVYVGWVDRNQVLNGGLGGRVDFKITPSGACSGTLLMGRNRLAFKGSLGLELGAPSGPGVLIAVNRSGKPTPQPLILNCNITPGTGTLFSGKISAGASEVEVSGWRQVWHSRLNPALSYAGIHVFGIEQLAGVPADPLVPDGSGYGSMTVASTGRYRISGKTGDGTPFVTSSFIGPTGQAGAFALLYGGAISGALTGRLNLDLGSTPEDASTHRVTGGLDWSRPDRRPKGGTLYPAGFGPIDCMVRGGKLRPSLFILEGAPSSEESDLNFFGGGLDSAERNPSQRVNLLEGNRLFLPESQSGDRLTFRSKTGLFQGTATLSDPHWGKPEPARWTRTLRFEGVVIPVDNGRREGVGFFLLPQIPEANPIQFPPQVLSGRLLWKAP